MFSSQIHVEQAEPKRAPQMKPRKSRLAAKKQGPEKDPPPKKKGE